MSVSDQLGAPDVNNVVEGRFTLHKYHLCNASVAAPVTPVNIEAVQDVSAEPYSWGVEKEIFQQGGGDESLTIKRQPRYNGVIRMQAGKVGDFIAALLGITWSSAGEAALPLRMHSYPIATLEAICRTADNETHLFSKVYQDIILKDFNFGSPMDDEIIEIPFMSKHDPFIIPQGTELVYDQFSGDGSTTDFTLSSTPLTATNVSDLAREDWELDDLVYVKVKGASDNEGTRQRSGVSVSDTTLSFTTAPASGATVQVLYIKASS